MQKNQTEERKEGPTPNGGAYSIARFYDDDDKPVKKSAATKVVITEYTEDDSEINRTYGSLQPE